MLGTTECQYTMLNISPKVLYSRTIKIYSCNPYYQLFANYYIKYSCIDKIYPYKTSQSNTLQ